MTQNRHFLNIPVVYKLGTRFIGYIPKRLAYLIAELIAEISIVLYKDSFIAVSENIKLPFPDYTVSERKKLSRRIFRNYAKYLVDYGRYNIMKNEDILREFTSYQGRENLEMVIEMQKGIILLTGHIGNWELGGLFLSSYGLKTNVITLPDEDTSIHYLRENYRKKFNVNTITIGNSPLSSVEMLNVLMKKEVLAMLIDRYNNKEDGRYCDFFGKRKLFPIGPVILAKVSGAPIIVSFVVKERNGYKGIIESPIFVENGREDEALQEIVNILENYIIIYADQWYNFYPL